MSGAVRVSPLRGTLLAASECGPDLPHCGRVVVRVNSSADGHSGTTVWAPLCADASDVAAGFTSYRLAAVICHQLLDPLLKDPAQYVSTSPLPPIPIPTDAASAQAALFFPSNYTRWATVVGGLGANAEPAAIQELLLQISSTPCASGHMAAVSCSIDDLS